MEHITPYRDSDRIHRVIQDINRLVISVADTLQRPVQIMEVCGGHTHTLFRYGLPQLLNDRLEFVHGPGCPVCVLPRSVIDQAVRIAQQPDVIFTTYGDALRVPGGVGSLQSARAAGADVRVLYSPEDAIQLATDNPHRQVVFFAIGFETTMPGTALTLQQARQRQLKNFSVLAHHITIMPTLRALLERDDIVIDGFIGPGHVSAIIGSEVYQEIAGRFQRPLVVSGFEPLDMVQSLLMLLKQLNSGRCEVENQYRRVVKSAGNRAALKAINDVFALHQSDALWRGLGEIPSSGAPISDAYAGFDAARRFGQPLTGGDQDQNGYCDQVMIGKLKPAQCPLFGKECHPQHPVGAMMVSSEGACAAYYRYQPAAVEESL